MHYSTFSTGCCVSSGKECTNTAQERKAQRRKRREEKNKRFLFVCVFVCVLCTRHAQWSLFGLSCSLLQSGLKGQGEALMTKTAREEFRAW